MQIVTDMLSEKKKKRNSSPERIEGKEILGVKMHGQATTLVLLGFANVQSKI